MNKLRILFLGIVFLLSTVGAYAKIKSFELRMGSVPVVEGMKVSIEFAWCPDQKAKGKGFWISTRELTRIEFDTIMGDPLYPMSTPFTKGISEYDQDLDMPASYSSNMPMDNMDYKDAQMLLDRLNCDQSITVSLPSKQQWIAACAQTADKINSCSVYDYAWFIYNSGGRPHPVMEKKANLIGLYDMYGNVKELVTIRKMSSNERLLDENTLEIGGGYRSQADEVVNMFSKYKSKERCGLRLCIENVKSPTFNKGYHVWKPKWTARRQPCHHDMCYNQNDRDRMIRWAADNDIKLEPCSILHCSYNRCSWNCDLICLSNNSTVSVQEIVDLYDWFHRVHAQADALEKAWKQLPEAGSIETQERGEPKITYEVRDGIFKAWRLLCRMSFDFNFWEMMCSNDKRVLEFCSQYKNELKSAWEKLWLCQCKVKRAIEIQKIAEEKESELENWRRSCATPEKIYERFRDCFVTITIGDSAGSGFIVRENGVVYLYTNRHVVDNRGKTKIRVAGNNRIKCSSLEYARNMDIARARVLNWKDIKSDILEFRASPPNLDEKIMVVGNSDGLGVQTLGKGTVLGISTDEDIIEISAEIVSGNSGGAVLDSTGQVVGVATFALKLENDWIKAGTRYARARRFALRPQGNVVW